MGRLRRATLRDILVGLRLYSSVSIDLAMYTLAFGDKQAALEVLRIEEDIDELYKEVIAKLILAFRDRSREPEAIGLVDLASALDTISDAAGDLATVTLRGYQPHPYVTSALCHGESVGLIRSRRESQGVPARVDVLLLRRGENYEIAPPSAKISPGDILVVRGPLEEVAELSRALGEEGYAGEKCAVEARVQAAAGDQLAAALLSLKALSRSMLDLAFYSLLNNDASIAETVWEMKEYANKAYFELLELTLNSSYPGRAHEMTSLLAFAKSMEEISDAAVRIANVVRNRHYSPVLSQVVREGEEAYVRVRLLRPYRSPSEMGLEDRGFIPVALRRAGDWRAPVPNAPLEEGDELILKFYRTGGEAEELRGLGLVVGQL
ncbi:MAG: PhoU domain-containing protein [Acidilobaceae archaeon]